MDDSPVGWINLALPLVLLIAVAYLARGPVERAASLLVPCRLELAAARCLGGCNYQLDLTLRCPPAVLDELEPQPPRKADPKLTAAIRAAVGKSLPAGSRLRKLEPRAEVPGAADSLGAFATITEGMRHRAAQDMRLHVSPGGDNDPDRGQALPDYFHTFQEAARYANVDRRTIQNWKTREWLKVEQEGRKIRIARAELDRCKKQR